MPQLECPSCKLKIQALGAPVNCPRCLVRKGERVALIAATLVAAVDRPVDDGAAEWPPSAPRQS